MNPEPCARILIVDDEPGVLETIAAILSAEGYQVQPSPECRGGAR